MSVKALSAVFEDSCATDSAFVVALALADWCDQNGRCYPSYGQIARKARVSRATAVTAIRALLELGEWSCTPRGQAPTPDDDEAPTSIRRQRRNSYRCELLRRPAEVVQASDYLETDEPAGGSPAIALPRGSEVVQPSTGGSPTDKGEVVQPTRSHIRNRPSDKPSDRPSAAAAAAAVEADLKALVNAWNDRAIAPIAKVANLYPVRRAKVRARLAERPLAEHLLAIDAIMRSAFCGGAGDRRFVASFDWYIASDQPATKALEGAYDDPPRPVTDGERERAQRIRAGRFGRCHHDPACQDGETCLRRIVIDELRNPTSIAR